MNLSLKWLKEFVDIDVTPREYAADLTMSGSKVETYFGTGDGIEKVVTGKVLSIEKHPDADKLVVTQIDVAGERPLQIVTGASNLKVGDVVPVCLDGSTLPGGKKIKSGKLRGVESEGMLCSLGELGLSVHDFPDAIEDGIFVITEPCALGEDIKTAIGLDDTVVEFEITSNRADCFSMLGLARESAATYGLPLKEHTPAVKGGAGNAADLISVRIDAPDLCKRYCARVVKNIKIAPSPRFIRERLRACGVRPINNIVDITNYVMLEYGQPMHAFDRSFLQGGEIIVRRAADGEQIVTLDGGEHTLTSNNLVICDAQRPVAVAGVMGGENSEIRPETVDVVFESANFDGASVRRTAKHLGLRTESSSRFEKGLDPNLAKAAVDRACELCELLGCGEVCDGTIDIYPSELKPWSVPFDPDWINRFLGTEIPRDEMERYLTSLSFGIDGDAVLVPTFRGDVERPADVAEEVARLYGYNKIPSTLFAGGATQGMLSPKQKFERTVSNTLLSQGYSEIYTYTFISPKFYDAVLMPQDSAERNSIKIQNPLGEDTSIMRTTPLPSLLDILSRNYAQRNAEVALFELAKIFLPVPGEELPCEKKIITFGSYGCGDFFAAKGALEAVLHACGVREYDFSPKSDHYAFHPGKTAAVSVDGCEIGLVGAIHPSVLANYGIKGECFAAMIDAETLFAHSHSEKSYKPLPKFPAVTRDFSMLCDDAVMVREIEAVFRKHGKKLLESVKLFDVYKGAQIPDGKKSVAYSITLRADDRTLTDEEISKITDKIIAELSEHDGITVRKG